MRYLILTLALATVTGCGKAPPTLAGGKPVAHWVEALHDPDPKVRKQAVEKLGNVGVADAGAFPAVLEALRDADPRVRCAAILAVLKFGDRAREAMPQLTEMQRGDHDLKVRGYAAKALEQLAGGTNEAAR